MERFVFRFLHDESGVTSIEYSIIVTGIAVAIVTAISALGGSVSDKFDSVRTGVQ